MAQTKCAIKITGKQHENPHFKQQKPVNTDAKACLLQSERHQTEI